MIEEELEEITLLKQVNTDLRYFAIFKLKYIEANAQLRKYQKSEE